MEGFHHDGHDCYELKRLTDKGTEYADRHGFAHDKTLHQNIMKNNFYSALPRLAGVIFGRVYETISA